jgi:peptide subunit release factor 1 (eRF1)
MKIPDKITCKCLRCGMPHTNSVDWFVNKSHQRCPACGGEMDMSGFSRWVIRQSEQILANIEQRRSR